MPFSLKTLCEAADTALTALTTELEDAVNNAQAARDKLQERFDGRSEKWQESDKGEELQEKIEAAGDLADALEELKETVDQAVEGVQRYLESMEDE